MIFLLIFSVPSIALSQQLLSNQALTKTDQYTNNKIGFKIKNSPLWEISSKSSKDRSCDYCVIVLESTNPKITISILAKNLSHFKDRCDCESLEDLIRYQYGLNYLSQDIISLSDNKTKLPNGMSGWQMEYYAGDKIYYVLWFITNGVFYEISFGAEPERYSKYLQEVKIEIGSFEFFKPSPQELESEESSRSLNNPSFLSNLTP